MPRVSIADSVRNLWLLESVDALYFRVKSTPYSSDCFEASLDFLIVELGADLAFFQREHLLNLSVEPCHDALGILVGEIVKVGVGNLVFDIVVRVSRVLEVNLLEFTESMDSETKPCCKLKVLFFLDEP